MDRFIIDVMGTRTFDSWWYTTIPKLTAKMALYPNIISKLAFRPK